jgi:hypothetical protein
MWQAKVIPQQRAAVLLVFETSTFTGYYTNKIKDKN